MKTSDNPILDAVREHLAAEPAEWDTEMAESWEEPVSHTVIRQWAHWLKWGDQEVSSDPEHIAQAELVIFRLADVLGVR